MFGYNCHGASTDIQTPSDLNDFIEKQISFSFENGFKFQITIVFTYRIATQAKLVEAIHISNEKRMKIFKVWGLTNKNGDMKMFVNLRKIIIMKR